MGSEKNLFDNDTTQRIKVLVIGSGPAGLTAALYTARANLNPVVLTGIELGGQVSLTFAVENYPGFPDGIGGAQLVELLQKQAERFGASIQFNTADRVDLSQRPFRVHAYNSEYLAETLIIATGATPIHLNIPGEAEFLGRGVSYCATCDGWFFKEKNVVVVGGGDSALEEGLFLTRYAKSVTIIHRRDQLRASALLQKRVLENPKIKIIWNTVISVIRGADTVTNANLRKIVTGEENDYPTEGVFIFIGHSPNSQLFSGQLDMDEKGYLVRDEFMRTNIPGVFAAGEVADPHFRQVVTSAGMGAAAAIGAIQFIQRHEQGFE